MPAQNRDEALMEAFFAAMPDGTQDITKTPNAHFDAAGKAHWFEIFHLPNRPIPKTCGRQGEDEGTGLMQINVMLPLGGGDKLARDTETALRLVFTAGAAFPYPSAILKIRECGRSGPGFQSGDYWAFPIEIYWESRIQRNA